MGRKRHTPKNIIFAHIDYVNKINNHPKNENWTAYSFNSLDDIAQKILELKDNCSKIENLMIQSHVASGTLVLLPGPDKILETKGVIIGQFTPKNDDDSKQQAG